MYIYFILHPLYLFNKLLVSIYITARQRDLVESSEFAQQLMFLYCIFSPYYIFLWPRMAHSGRNIVVSLIKQIQRQLCFDVSTPSYFRALKTTHNIMCCVLLNRMQLTFTLEEPLFTSLWQAGRNIQILSKTWVSSTIWRSFLRTGLKSNLSTALTTQNTTANICIISHVQNTTAP